MEAIERLLTQLATPAILFDHSRPNFPEQLCKKHNLKPFPICIDSDRPAGCFTFQDSQTKQKSAEPACISDAAILGRTAGTTGAPRLVAWSQASLYRSANTAAEWMGLTEQDRSLCLMPFITLHTLVRSCLPGLIRGGSVVCTPGFDKVRALQWIDRYHPTYMTAVPGIYRELLKRADGRSQETSLKFLASGSDRIDVETVDRIAEIFNVPVREFYGMNEVSPMLAATPAGLKAQSNGAVGKSLDDWTLEIRDEAGVALPQGRRVRFVLGAGFSILL